LRNTGSPLNSSLAALRTWAVPQPNDDTPSAQGDAAQPANDDASAKPQAEATAAKAGADNPEQAKTPDEQVAAANPSAKTPVSALYVGGFSSNHPGGVNFAFGDGSVRFISESVELAILQQLANRADGKLLPPGIDWH